MDAVWEIHQKTHNQTEEIWMRFEQEAQQKHKAGEFDEIFLTQIPPNNFQNYDGTSRSSLFRGYPHPVTVPVQPVVRLTQAEIEAVNNFIATHNVRSSNTVILIEAASTSGQSFITPEFALQIACSALIKNPSLLFILSSDKKIEIKHKNIIDGSELTFRENAEITKYCHLLVGCSSGISWLATSDWAKPLPQIQLLCRKTRMYASMLHDAKYFHLPTENILELNESSPSKVATMILSVLENGFARTRERFQVDIPIKFDFYFSQIFHELFKKKKYVQAATAISNAYKRYDYDKTGIKELDNSVRTVLRPYLVIKWNKLKIDEKEALAFLGCNPDKKYSVVYRTVCLFQLCLLSFKGEYFRVARLFVKNMMWRSA